MSITGIPSLPFPTDPSESDVFAATIFGCPISSYLSLQSVCAITNAPDCVSNQPETGNWDSTCCGSVSSFGVSIASCFSQNAPPCFDTKDAEASLTDSGTETVSDPCAQFATGAAGIGSMGSSPGGSGQTTSGSPSPTTGGATAQTGSGSGSGTTPAPTGSAAGQSGSSGSGAAAAATSSKPSAASPRVGGPSLKVWVGVALLGSLAVLRL